MPSPTTAADPDHFLNFRTPGAQEWWYFDAISDDGRDALVLVWYAGLPFDPAYGVATLRHLKDPRRFPAPDPLDHCALGISWYRDGKTVAYALNAYRRDAFAFSGSPIAVEVAGNRMDRGPEGYRLRVDTPAVDGTHRIRADLHFLPAPGTQPLRRTWDRPRRRTTGSWRRPTAGSRGESRSPARPGRPWSSGGGATTITTPVPRSSRSR